MMKVLQINTTVNKGSTGRIAEQIGETVINNKGESYIAYSIDGLPSKSNKIQIGNRIDFYSHALQTRLLDNHGFSSKGATKKLINHIRKINPDIIHLHNIHGYFLHIGVLFNYLNSVNIPLVWTFHDCWPFTGHCSYFDRVNCEKWKTECFSCPLMKTYPASWFIDNSKNNFWKKKKLFSSSKNLTIVTPSLWLADLVSQSFFKKIDVVTINNGINLESFNHRKSNFIEKYHLKHKKIILGVASVWSRRKGFNDFIELSKILDSKFVIILVGLDKKLIKNLPNNFIGIEKTENVFELAEIYSEANVYINPTYSDNFPTTNIEALACGTPVITYNTGGSPEAIDEKTGLVVEKGDIGRLKEAIETILEDKKIFTSKMCRTRAEKYFNKNDRFQDYYGLYKKILKNK